MDSEKGLTENEILELRELRVDAQTLSEKIKVLEIDKEDVELEIKHLKEWKKGRGFMLIIPSIPFVLMTLTIFSLMDFQFASSVQRGTYYTSAFVYSMSSASLVFAFMMWFAFAILAFYFCLKSVIEVGNSRPVREYARRHYLKNYFNSMELCQLKENAVNKELLESRKQLAEDNKRISVLEAKEIPWYEQ